MNGKLTTLNVLNDCVILIYLEYRLLEIHSVLKIIALLVIC